MQERRRLHQRLGQLHLHLPRGVMDRQELRKTRREDLRVQGGLTTRVPAEAGAHPAPMGNICLFQGELLYYSCDRERQKVGTKIWKFRLLAEISKIKSVFPFFRRRPRTARCFR